jgi:hypothetical protein
MTTQKSHSWVGIETRLAQLLLVSISTVTLTACQSSRNVGPSTPDAAIDSHSSIVLPSCGDNVCEAGEGTANCPDDCGSWCGDGACNLAETATHCPEDCSAVSTCGDGICQSSESTVSCPADCGSWCGDDACNGAETAALCPQDCAEPTSNPPSQACGDGECNGTEDTTNCVADCGTWCNDGVCNGTESLDLCPQDCGNPPSTVACGDEKCEGDESPANCEADCPHECGDTLCTGGENTTNCVTDCGTQCGDGVCNGTEDEGNCSSDCAKEVPPPTTATTSVRYVRVTTTKSPSWVAWLEIEALDAVGTNRALFKSVSATSSTGAGSSNFAVDGDSSTPWNAGDFSPATITIDLGKEIPIAKVRMHVAQNPEGTTTHHLYFGDANMKFTKAHTFIGHTKNGDWLTYQPSGGSGNNPGPGSGNTPGALNQVKWLHTDVSNWAVTANLSSVTVQNGIICMEYDKKNSWPSVSISHNSGNGTVDVVANPWVFANYNDQWYAATWEWLAVGSTCKNMSSVAGDHIKQPPFGPANWKPQSGQKLYFMVSGLARFSNIKNVSERSNIVKVIWP